MKCVGLFLDDREPMFIWCFRRVIDLQQDYIVYRTLKFFNLTLPHGM
jgi:hypothetical protein